MRRAIQRHLNSRDVARVIYGSVIGLAVVVALEVHPPSAGVAAGALGGTALAVTLAEVYSEYIGTELRLRRRVRASELARLMVDGAAVGFGAGFPTLFFVLAAVDVVSLDTAFALAKWTGLGLIFAYAFGAARLAGSTVRAALVQAVAVGAVGCLLIVLKALLH